LFWRAYFWNYGVITLVGLIWEYSHSGGASLAEVVGLVFPPLALLALGGRAFGASFLAVRTWRALLLFCVGWETFALAIGLSPSSAMLADLRPATPETHAAGMEGLVEFVRIMNKFVVPAAVWLSALPPLVAMYQNAYSPRGRPAAEG
jgi:hypothetical protein